MRVCVAAKPRFRKRAAPSSTWLRCDLLRRGARTGLRSSKGGVAAADQIAGRRLGARRHPRQRRRTGLDRDTAMTQALRDDPAREEPILARTPMGRWGEPATWRSGAVPVLARRRFVTGVVLPVDGGYLDRLMKEGRRHDNQDERADAAGDGIQHEIATRRCPTTSASGCRRRTGVWFRPLLLNTVSGSGATCCGCAAPASSAATSIRARPRLRHQGPLALSRARLGGRRRALTSSSRRARSTR